MSASLSYSLNRLQCILSFLKTLEYTCVMNNTPEERPCKAQLLQSMPLLCCCEKQSKKYNLVTINQSHFHKAFTEHLISNTTVKTIPTQHHTTQSKDDKSFLKILVFMSLKLMFWTVLNSFYSFQE